MRLWTYALFRLLVIAAVGLSATAALIGRSAMRPAERREPAVPRYAPIADYRLEGSGTGLRLLNVETGRVERIPLTGSDRIEYAACSPWRDGRGRVQVAGRWLRVDGLRVLATGLARCALPGGEVVDRIETGTLVAGALCWYPGYVARVLFAGLDGRLYQFDFDEGTGKESSSSPVTARRPTPLAWRCPAPWANRFAIEKPTWPSDPRLASIVVASLRPLYVSGDANVSPHAQLWWLRLGEVGTKIVAAGRLIVPAPGRSPETFVHEQMPCLATRADGGLVLSYLARKSDGGDLQLRLAPVTIDAATGAPRAEEADVIDVAAHRAFSLLAFSPDANWVYAFPEADPLPSRADRFSVAQALVGRAGSRHVLRPRGIPVDPQATVEGD